MFRRVLNTLLNSLLVTTDRVTSIMHGVNGYSISKAIFLVEV